MLSAMFRRDYDALKAEGVDLTPEDIVRLNALAVKAQAISECAIQVHVQRAAFLPKRHWWHRSVVLRELTIAHWVWLEQVSELFCMGNLNTAYILYAYAMSRPADSLPDAFDIDAVKKSVSKFAKKNLLWLTNRQLFGAVDYCLVGANWTAHEGTPEEAKVVGDIDVAKNTSPILSIVTMGRAYGIGLTTDDLNHLLPSEIEEAVLIAQLKSGLVERDGTRARAVADYVRAREEIRNRKKDNEDRGSDEKENH